MKTPHVTLSPSKGLLILLLLSAASCKKQNNVAIEYRATGNKYTVTYTDASGQQRSELHRHDWSTTVVLEEGATIEMRGCTVQYDSTFIVQQGVVVDTVLTEVYDAGVIMWAFHAGDQLAIKSAGANPGQGCDGFTAKVPEQ